MLFRQVFSPSLDPKRRWYALTTGICGGPTKRFGNSTFTEQFEGEIHKVRLESVYDRIVAKCPPQWFDSGRRKEEVYVGTAFDIIGGQLRLRELKNHGFVSSPRYEMITKYINEFDLEELDDPHHKGNARSVRLIGLESQLSLFKNQSRNS